MNGRLHNRAFNHAAANGSSSGAASPRSEGNFFVVANTLIDDGHLASLTRVELKVYLVLKRHENSGTGTMWPGATRIARLIGHKSLRHVRRALARLIEGGYVENVSVGGGRTSAHRRIRLPEANSATGGRNGHALERPSPVADSAMGAVAESATPPVAVSATPPVAESATRTRRVEHPRNKTTKNRRVRGLAA